MPIAVLDRIIKSSSNPGDIVLDPFNGSGTTVVSAALHGRQYVGIDQSEAYVSYARKRLEHALEKAASAKGDGTIAPASEAQVFAGVNDPDRASKVMTETDAFGRKRVARGRRRVMKSA
jgi:23S rRNA G2445 N2-methylase RlmL